MLNQHYKYLHYIRPFRSAIRAAMFNSEQVIGAEIYNTVSLEVELFNGDQVISSSIGNIDLDAYVELFNDLQTVESDVIHRELNLSVTLSNNGQTIESNVIHAALNLSSEVSNLTQSISSNIIHLSSLQSSIANAGQVIEVGVTNKVSLSVNIINSSQVTQGEISSPPVEEVYSYLYNWFVLSNFSSPLPAGTKVPTSDEYKILEGNMDSVYPAGDPEWDRIGYDRGYDVGKNMKSLLTWTGNATNGLYNLNITSSGITSGVTGNIVNAGTVAYLWTSTSDATSADYRNLRYFSDKILWPSNKGIKQNGMSIRFILDRALTAGELALPNGSIISTVYDYDGNPYNMIKIGTQAWSDRSLLTTRYNNGTSIPNIEGGTTWTTLTTGAYCRVRTT